MVNLFVVIRQAPPLVDTSIVPEVPGVLYALFDSELTVQNKKGANPFGKAPLIY